MAFPEIQVKKDLREHVLARPDTYIGSMVFDKYKVYTVKNKKIVLDTVEYTPAFERTVIEIGSNAIDNVWRSSQFKVKCSAIRFTYDLASGVLSCWNDGLTIPIEKSKIPEINHLYNPSIVFGLFMSGTNYNDSEQRRSSGRNGLGSKACNTFSSRFTVETQDEKGKLFFSQTWKNNMGNVDDPIITKKDGKGFTKITWLPDYKRFGMAGLTPDIAGLLTKYFYDVAMITKIPVYVNDELIPVKSLVDYAQSFLKTPTEEIVHFTTNDSEVVVLPGRPPITVAFTNGIPNPDGGVHVASWCRAVFSPLTTKLNPKKEEEKKGEKKIPKLTMVEVRNHFSIFIVCSLDNPTFNSQEKVKLTAPKPNTSVKPSQIQAMMKWDVITRIKEILDAKNLRAQKKLLNGPKTKGFKNIKKLEDANFAGTEKSHECTLMYCEGDSAKNFAIAGIDVGFNGKAGRDFFGVIPCGGKIMNVRKNSVESIAENEGIQALKGALGLEVGVDYTVEANYRTLRYGCLMVISDADTDGIHIEGLCQNFFHRLYPSLLKRSPSFLISMRTPIVRVQMKSTFPEGAVEKKFYRVKAFQDFQIEFGKYFKKKPRYFKGLGSSNDKQVVDSFGKRVVFYDETEDTDKKMLQAFGDEDSDLRKKWIAEYDPDGVLVIEDETSTIIRSTFTDFIDNELILHSIENCQRTIPTLFDGLKEVQKKILFTCLNLKLFSDKEEMRVDSLAGAIASSTEYHHGDPSIQAAIKALASNYVGSNNISLLQPLGQFGSRCTGEDGAAHGRYIFTKFDEIFTYIFRMEDLPLLEYIQGEEKKIEPKYFMPVIPMILVNGAAGIGTGWSTNIPSHNPLDIVDLLKIWIKDNLEEVKSDDHIIFSSLPEIHPWYQGFTGEIVKDDKPKTNRYITRGVINTLSDKTKEIVELPIGRWTDTFRDKLKELRAEEQINDFADYSSKFKIRFIVKENEEKLSCSIKSLKLSSYLSLNNMVCFDVNGKIHRYRSVDEIIYDFAILRVKYYQLRKDNMIAQMRDKLIFLPAKRKFVEEVINEIIIINRKKRADIEAILIERKYPQQKDSFDYLLKMSIDSFTDDMIRKLDGQVIEAQAEFERVSALTPRSMWEKELDEFVVAYKQYKIRWQSSQDVAPPTKSSAKIPKRRARK